MTPPSARGEDLPVLIVGGGLAGALLGWTLHHADVPSVIAEANLPGAASPVAAGLVNPLAGASLRPDPAASTALVTAQALYDRLARETGGPLFYPRPIWRFLTSADQARTWARRRTAEAAPYDGGDLGDPAARHPALQSPHGAFVTQASGYLDVPALLARTRGRWEAADAWISARVAPEAIRTDSAGGVRWAERRYRAVVWCQGWRALEDPAWAGRAWRPARGEILTARPIPADAPWPEAILNGGAWILPRGDGQLRVGSTYAWSHFDAPAAPTADAAILGRTRLYYTGGLEITDRLAGTRPATTDARPVVGAHPARPGHYILNGLGSKGALLGPLAAARLTHLLNTGEAPPRAWQWVRFR